MFSKGVLLKTIPFSWLARCGISALMLLSASASATTLWLDKNWHPTKQAKAKFYQEYDNAQPNADGLWPVKIYYADSKKVRFEGRCNSPKDPGADKSLCVGPYKFFFANGQLESDGEFDKEGKFSGFTRIFEEDGKLNRTMEMAGGLINGELRYFYDNGKLRSSYQMMADEKQGPYKRFAEDGTTVIATGHYKNNKEEGEFRSYYNDGQLMLVRHLVQGKLEGDYIRYRKDGSIEEHNHFSNNELDGLSTDYYRNGNKQRENTYSKGDIEGVSRYWDKDGALIRERHYHNDKQEGTDKSWNSDGQLTALRNFHEGRLSGEQLRYFDGTKQLRSKEQYNQQHQLLSSIEYDKDGNIRRETSYDVSQKQPISDFKSYKDGKLAFRRQKDPNRDWSFEQEFDAQGKVISYVTNIDGRREGKYLHTTEQWGSDSKIRTEANFKQGRYDGDYKETLLPENIVLEQGRYEQDKKVAEWHYRDEDTKRTEYYDSNSLRNGELVATTLDGKLLRREHYQHGIKVGDYEHRNADGMLTAKGQYVADKRDGEWLYSDDYDDDKIWRGRYRQGKKIGEWRATDTAGYLLGIEHYDDQGRRQGKFYKFRSDGLLTEIESYRNGELDGEQISYSMGKPFYQTTYKNGELVDRKELD